MHIAFRKASDGLVSSLIRLRTGSQYSHCEIVIAGGIGRPADCFSSSRPDGGVRRKSILLKPENWDLVSVSIDEQRLQRVLRTEIGKPYDTIGMLMWGTPVSDDLKGKNAWFCSELCAYVLRLSRPWSYSPGSLFELLTCMRGDAGKVVVHGSYA